ncbi:hypothetical protein JYK21_14250 [Ralstonia pickettii]|nr:hypothetical protein [Ralstonia pickettii]
MAQDVKRQNNYAAVSGESSRSWLRGVPTQIGEHGRLIHSLPQQRVVLFSNVFSEVLFRAISSFAMHVS